MRRARLVDVATEAGVSTATASLVLRGLPGPSADSKAAVEAAAARLDYRPDRAASALASHRSRHVGVLLDISSTFHAELVDVLDAAAADAGLDLVIATRTRRRTEQAALESLLDQRCEALILLGPDLTETEIDTVASELPTVVVGRSGTALATGVLASDAAGMEAVVAHLVRERYSRIAYVDGPRGPIATARRKGFRRAMASRGLAIEVVPGGADESAGLAAAKSILTLRERPDAVVCFNDHCAVGVRTGLVRGGFAVPDEIGVTGYDDAPVARLATIELTTVSQDPDALAAATITVLQQRLSDPDLSAPKDVVVSPRLIARAST